MSLFSDMKLSEICALVTDGTHDSPKLQESGVPFIKGKHINTGRIDFVGCDYITDDDHQKCIKRVKPEKDDILIANIGSIGDCARVETETEFSIKNVALLRPDPEIVDPSYFYHFVKSPLFQGRLLNLRLGSAQPYVSLAAFRGFEVPIISDTKIQKKIGQTADAYEGLIENNRRRIALLEEAARLLYREWFVHFRFPGHEHVKIVDGIPEGWEEGTIADLGEAITGKTPSKKKPEFYGDDVPFIKTPDMHGNAYVVQTEEYLSNEGAKSQQNKTLPKGSILVSCIGSVGVVSMNGSPAQTNQQINSVVPRKDDWRFFCYSFLKSIKPRLEALGGGATMANVNKSKFQSIPVLLPVDELTGGFQSIVEPQFAMIETLIRQNIELAKARDLLLPRLMDGRLEVAA
ncbi:restriction endonuclease subunit S [Ponticaulis sp.]|uniref:restriction endonuclease subunit S n=1 Tax=Ponticaulis sp. TaxID=2020902 RepID=UPI000B670FBA|nr:restriction endonuclease subunit S [Ponticaulis sp.]MAI91314.1 hypothetical protein [Ponticaulis sp.]OUX97915.1 MAG: hypothetical protein CBB65_12790 [Hyphomonadaceae bacterium TMED5]|tara:strand:+ start:63955 stop:65166 length:1212 start_codon:yes stop_codon:yes gene_type:complete